MTPEPIDLQKWRFRRGVLRVALYVYLVPIIYFGSDKLIRINSDQLTPADFAWDATRYCVPIVRAIMEYRRDNGRLPDRINDLVPKYLPAGSWHEKMEAGKFIYRDYLELSRSYGFDLDHSIVYDFRPTHEGWSVRGPIVNGPIPLALVTLPAATLPTADGK